MNEYGVDQSLLDSLARRMRSESSEELGERVRDGIPAVLPHGSGTEMRVPTTRQFQEAWVAAHELERRARGLAGEPPPAPVYEIIAIDRGFADGREPVREHEVVLPPRIEKPVWWDDEPSPPEYPLKDEPLPDAKSEAPSDFSEEPDLAPAASATSMASEASGGEPVAGAKLPLDAETQTLAERIRHGMPRLIPDTERTQRWHVPLAHELEDAQTALTVLLQRVSPATDDPAE